MKYSKFYKKFDKLLKGKTWEDYWTKQTHKDNHNNFRHSTRFNSNEDSHFRSLNTLNNLEIAVPNLPKLKYRHNPIQTEGSYKMMSTDGSYNYSNNNTTENNFNNNQKIENTKHSQLSNHSTSPNKIVKLQS